MSPSAPLIQTKPSPRLEVLPPTNDTARRWGIQRATVLAFTETLPIEHKASLRWLDEFARKHNFSRREMAEKLLKPNGQSYGDAAIYNYLTGRSGGALDNFVASVVAFKKQIEASAIPANVFPFVETSLSKSIADYASLVWQRRRIGLMLGDSQSGKTRNLKEFVARQPHGQASYIQMPTDGQLSYLVAFMCHERNISLKYNSTQQRLKLAESIDASMLLIFDEIEECASRARSGGHRTAIRSHTIDFIRWLRDTRGCAILLVGAPEAMDMLNDQNYSAFVRTLRRGMPPYWLKAKPTTGDLNKFADAAKLPLATGAALNLQTTIINRYGLGFWIEVYLQGGKDIADASRQRLTWDHVLDAHAEYLKGDEQAKVAQTEYIASRKVVAR